MHKHPIDDQPEPPAWADPALPGGAAGPPLRAPHGEDLRAVAAAVSAVSWHAPSAGDGQRGGERFSHAPGGGGSGERLHAEPGPLGAAVSVPKTAGAGSGSGGSGACPQASTVAGSADRRRGAIGLAAARRKRSAGSWTAVWQWAAIDGGSAAEGA